MEQLQVLEERRGELEEHGAVVVAVSRDSVEELAGQQEGLGLTLLSDASFESARRFRSYDDFEDIELHSTFLLDPEGRIHWSQIGGEPFMDVDYLLGELERMEGDPLASGAATGDLEVGALR